MGILDGLLEWLAGFARVPSLQTPIPAPQPERSANLDAFLMTVRNCEGTASDRGYRYLYGSTPAQERLFDSFEDHPRVKFWPSGIPVPRGVTPTPYSFTTAAGAYQITESTYDGLRKRYPGRWAGFSPQEQDEMATELVSECGALEDAIGGRLDAAVAKCGSQWASLPSSKAGQSKRTVAFVKDAYARAGGVLA